MSAQSPGDVRPDRTTLLTFLGVVIFGGANAIGVRQTVLELAPFWGASLRFAAAGIIMAGVVIATRRSFPRGRSFTGAVLYGANGKDSSHVFLLLRFKPSPALTSSPIIALTPLF